MKASWRTSRSMASWSVRSTNCTASAGMPASAMPSRMAAASARLDSSASLPPARMTALPDFRHSAAASTVTLGRDS